MQLAIELSDVTIKLINEELFLKSSVYINVTWYKKRRIGIIIRMIEIFFLCKKK